MEYLGSSSAHYLNVEPDRLRFCYGPYGKPYLAAGFGDGTLRFNLAHSHELAVEVDIKATRDGLAHSLDQFDVSLVPREPARLLNVERDPREASRWSLYALTPVPDYVATLTIGVYQYQGTKQ